MATMRDEVFLIGRILLGLVFLSNGIGHFRHTDASAGYAEFKKVPNARLMVQLTGVLMLLGGAAIVLGAWMDLAALLLAILVVVFALMMHRFWEESDPQTRPVEEAQFLKNVAIAGGLLILVAFPINVYTITDPVF